MLIWLALFLFAARAACAAFVVELVRITPLIGVVAAIVFYIRGVMAAGGTWRAYAVAAIELLLIGSVALGVFYASVLVCGIREITS